MKKVSFKLLAGVLSSMLAFFAFAGCSGEDEPIEKPVGASTVEISYTLKSFGDSWIKEAVSRFNEVFADRGYSAVITRNDPVFEEDNVKNEITDFENNTYDLYIMTGNAMTLIDKSYSILKKRGESILEDLTDVYNSKVINLDGSDGNETVISTRHPEMLYYCRYDFDNEAFKGKYYGYQWTSAYGGILMNKKVLADFGFDHAPRTTREMQAMCEYILDEGRKASTGYDIYPVTWGGSNTAGYSEYSVLTWLAQYMGVEEYDDFFAMKPKTGSTIENGYDVYDNVGIKYALKAMQTFFDGDYAAEGTVNTLDHLFSDQVLIDGEALFEFTGDWAYNEMVGFEEYSQEELDNIVVIPVPVLSELADKIGLNGTAEQKDALLSDIIKDVDGGRTDERIAADHGLTAAQVAVVREARGIYYDLGRGHQAYIPSYSDAKDAAKLFLRFISSKEFSDTIYSKNSNGITANVNAAPTSNAFLRSLSECCRKSYSTPIAEATILSEIRFKGGITYTFEPLPYYGQLAQGMANHYPECDAEAGYEKIKKAMHDNWEFILKTVGLS